MESYPAVRGDWCPTHPRQLLALDVLPATGKTKTELARLLGMPVRRFSAILDEKRSVSAEDAVRLGAMFGDGPQIWMRMQAAYDLWHARRAVDVGKIPKVTAAGPPDYSSEA